MTEVPMPNGVPQQARRSGQVRWGRAQESGIADPYKRPYKLPEPAVCRHCGAVYRRGAWRWTEPPEGAVAMLCQACLRVRDRYPAGMILLTGSYVEEHRTEILALVHHIESVERNEHPLNRIMSIEQPAPDRLVIATTDIHLPHRIGEAIKHAHHGRLFEDFDKNGYFMRTDWRRDVH